MAYRIKGLGWLPDPPDHRDLKADSKEGFQRLQGRVQEMAQAAPEAFQPDALARRKAVDLRKYCSPVENQGDIGSCTAHSVCGLVEYLQRTIYGEHLDASRLFLYKATRSFLGWTGDTGAFVRSTIKALRLFGVPPEDYYPYATARYDEDPPAFAFAFAGNYKAIEYYRLDGLDRLKDSLAKGVPFAFGFTCYQSLFGDDVRRTGNIPFPGPKEQEVGGHAVMAVGYDDAKGCLLIRNSWGTEWGDEGYGSLPYEYVTRGIAQDYWALTRIDVVPIGDARS
jgi:C1A family cysteine protease